MSNRKNLSLYQLCLLAEIRQADTERLAQYRADRLALRALVLAEMALRERLNTMWGSGDLVSPNFTH